MVQAPDGPAPALDPQPSIEKDRRIHEVEGEDALTDAGRQILRADPRARYPIIIRR